MFRRLILASAAALLTLLLPKFVSAEPIAPASQWVPPDAVLALEISQPAAVLDLAADPQVIETVTSLPSYQKAAKETKLREFLTGVSFLEARLDIRWPAALHKLLDGGLLLSIHPQNGVLLITEAKDESLLRELHEVVTAIAKGEAKKAGQPDRVASKEYKGVTAWTFGSDESHAIVDNRFIIANRPSLLKAVLDLRAKAGGESLASLPAFQAAKQAVGPQALGVAFVNMEVFKQLPPIQKALETNENPMAALLFAAVTDAMRQANWLGLGLDLDLNRLTLKATANGQTADAPSQAAFTFPSQPSEGALPNLDVPGLIAGLSLYRDLHSFYAAKDELFPERTSGLIFFENMMGIFFSGRDLTEEVLGETRPEIRFVVAEQEYDPSIGTPRIQLPSFGAIFRLRNPEKAALVAEEAWQKAVGLVNVTRGQKAQTGLIFDRVEYKDVRFSVAYFPTVDEKDKSDLDLRFNFRPALARVGEYLVVASTEGLAKDLIDAVKKQATESVKALAQTHSLIEVDAARLASILQTNRDAMVRQTMVGKGKTRDEAESEFDFLVTLVRYLGRVKLDIASPQGQQQASLEVELQVGSRKAEAGSEEWRVAKPRCATLVSSRSVYGFVNPEVRLQRKHDHARQSSQRSGLGLGSL